MLTIIAVFACLLLFITMVTGGHPQRFFARWDQPEPSPEVDWLKVASLEVEVFGTVKSYQAQGAIDYAWWHGTLDNVALQEFVSKRIRRKVEARNYVSMVDPDAASEFVHMPWQDREGI